MNISYLDLVLTISLVAALIVLLVNKFLSKKNESSVIQTSNFNRNYLEGINYLLNNQENEAIDIFIKMVEVDDKTIETHLILGNIFRRQGELEKAIKLHQNILARPELQSDIRDEILLELSNDYTKAGLLDRAENILLELKQSSKLATKARTNLIAIYESESEWNDAIANIKKLIKIKKAPDLNIRISHYYCQMFERHKTDKSDKQLSGYLKSAFKYNKSNPRAFLLEGSLYIMQNNYTKAYASFLSINKYAAEYFILAIDSLLQVQSFISQSEKKKLLNIISKKYKDNIGIVLKMYKHLYKTADTETAINFLQKQVLNNPSLQGLLELLQARLKKTQANEQWINVFNKSLKTFLKNSAKYYCSSCGYKAQQMNWYCPACKQWQTTRPVIGIDTI